MSLEFKEQWERYRTRNRIPKKKDLDVPDAVDRYFLRGWTPSSPIIDQKTKLIAFGSCFAKEVTKRLRAR
ncbi:unnamed protein product, partial [marine sediment metagenome]